VVLLLLKLLMDLFPALTLLLLPAAGWVVCPAVRLGAATQLQQQQQHHHHQAHPPYAPGNKQCAEKCLTDGHE
jgi:hypothetical protein